LKTLIILLKKYALYLAFLQAWVATLGSLYYSEIQRLEPCVLCWWQRIFMYPLVIIIPIGIIFKDKKVVYYVLPFSILGLILAFYQYLLQFTPLSRVSPTVCTASNPCEAIQISYFGFITIPFLSFLAFVAIAGLMLIELFFNKKNEHR